MDFIKTIGENIHYFTQAYSAWAKAIGLGLVGLIILWMITRLIYSSLKGKIPFHLLIIITKIIRYGGLVILASTVLTELGFNITALLGAAGVIGVAIGFASQASVSNIISGIFLIVEHPFKIGDLIEVAHATGFVESIDLLAVRLRTPDGKFIRIPNETLIKSLVTNKTFYKTRRITITATIDNKQNIAKVMAITTSVLEQLPVVRKDKAPCVWLDSCSMWTIDLGIWCWVDSRKISDATADIIAALYEAYKKENLTVSVSA